MVPDRSKRTLRLMAPSSLALYPDCSFGGAARGLPSDISYRSMIFVTAAEFLSYDTKYILMQEENYL